MTTRKKTHKFKALSDIQAVVNAAPSLVAAADRLGVNRTTLFRWLKAGKVTAPAAPTGPVAGAAPGQAPEAWAAAVRELGEMDATRSALVDLAVSALRLAQNVEESSFVRLSAMGRYQLLVKQLHLGVEPVAGATPVRQAPTPRVARAGGDPRAFLQAVK